MATISVTQSIDELPEWEPHDALRRIVVGIDGSPEALEAARQAGALAGPSATVELIAVAAVREESGLHLASAVSELAHTPARVITRAVTGASASAVLLSKAEGADLLVVGRHRLSRARGIFAASTASQLLHRAELPVLVAVRPSTGTFGERVLVAAGGIDHPEDAVRMAALVMGRLGSAVTVFRADWSRAAKPPAVRKAVQDLARLTVSPPDELIVGGSPARRIVESADAEGASLIVMSSRGLGGASALRSVSERVAHDASCSVLVVRRPRR